MAAHRHWRFLLTARFDGLNGPTPFSDALMAASVGGANLVTDPAAASASSTFYDGQHEASRAVPGQGSFWHPMDNANLPQWWAYDLGAGNDQAVNQVGFTSRPDGYWTQTASGFTVQSSDDGAAWADEWSVSDAAWTGPGQAQTFARPAGSAPGAPGSAQVNQALLQALSAASPPARVGQAGMLALVPNRQAVPTRVDQALLQALSVTSRPARVGQARLLALVPAVPSSAGRRTVFVSC